MKLNFIFIYEAKLDIDFVESSHVKSITIFVFVFYVDYILLILICFRLTEGLTVLIYLFSYLLLCFQDKSQVLAEAKANAKRKSKVTRNVEQDEEEEKEMSYRTTDLPQISRHLSETPNVEGYVIVPTLSRFSIHIDL